MLHGSKGEGRFISSLGMILKREDCLVLSSCIRIISFAESVQRQIKLQETTTAATESERAVPTGTHCAAAGGIRYFTDGVLLLGRACTCKGLTPLSTPSGFKQASLRYDLSLFHTFAI